MNTKIPKFLLPKTRRHHNNKGYRSIKNGNMSKQVKQMAKKLGLKYESNTQNIQICQKKID